jgi:hypothetical protein
MIEHLKVCTICGEELDDLNKLRKTLCDITADPFVRQRVLRALTLGPQIKEFWRQRVSVPRSIAATVLIALGLSVFGNAYLGLYQAAKAKGSTKSSDSTVHQLDQAARPTAAISTKAQPTGASPGKAASKIVVISMDFGMQTIRFVSESGYRINPKIYEGRERPSSDLRYRHEKD